LRKKIAWNGELDGVGFLVEVRLATRVFSKSFSKERTQRELNTSAEKSITFHYMNQANSHLVGEASLI